MKDWRVQVAVILLYTVLCTIAGMAIGTAHERQRGVTGWCECHDAMEVK